MRAGRLLATLLLLQSRGRVTAAEVARELEVSLATSRRDLQALSTAGVPVYPQPGRGGGWQLVGGARTDLTGLTSSEARTLLLLLGSSTTVAPIPVAARRKLIQALPEPFRDEAEAAAGAVVADRAGWGDRSGGRPVAVDVLQDAVIRRRTASFVYASRGRPARQRVVHPYGLVDKDGVWYLVAGTETGVRTFRVERMTLVEVLDEPAVRPPDFELAQHWGRVVEEIEHRRSVVTATVFTVQRLVPVLQSLFGRHCTPLETLQDGRVSVRVASHTAQSVAETLAGFGAAVQVVQPVEVRDELSRLGAELLATYGDGGATFGRVER
jgi:predicted DNA-binding transcriptional regulator YafY